MRTIALALPILVLLTACPPVVHVYVTNASGETITLGHFDASYPLAPGETQKIKGTRDTTGWRIERDGVVHTYDSRLDVPARYMAPRAFFVIVRVAVDPSGRLWLLPPDRGTEPHPVDPQPSGFPIPPS